MMFWKWYDVFYFFSLSYRILLIQTSSFQGFFFSLFAWEDASLSIQPTTAEITSENTGFLDQLYLLRFVFSYHRNNTQTFLSSKLSEKLSLLFWRTNFQGFNSFLKPWRMYSCDKIISFPLCPWLIRILKRWPKCETTYLHCSASFLLPFYFLKRNKPTL